MAVYNTESDAANTAVRAFLTKVGEFYLGQSFNTGSGNGKVIWETIKNEFFENKCAYCDTRDVPLQIEHILMFNRKEYGLHHPGNTIPSCKDCNNRSKDDSGNYLPWDAHLRQICSKRGELEKFEERKHRIENHMRNSRFKYPELETAEKNSIRVIAESLYENIKLEIKKSLALYEELDKSFVARQ